VHVVQQSRAASSGSHVHKLQRLVHGPTTPTNCSSVAMMLPPWLAGMFAHTQIGVWAGIAPHLIPRASKGGGRLIGVPSTRLTPPGFADLWERTAAAINIAEIKSTASSASAAPEAAHYVLRH